MSVAINIKRTKVFANTAARVSAKPDFAGQIGIQLDTLSIWQATSVAVGAWSGNFGVSSVFTVPTDGTGYVGLVAQASPVSEPSSGVRLFGTGTGFGFIDIDAHRAVFDMAAQLTSDRTYELPNASGTILLSGDLTGNVSLATTSGTTVTIGGGASASTLRLLEPSGSGTNYSEFKAQAQAANITYILPATIGSTGQVLSTTVSGTTGTLSWITPANGDVTLAGDNAFTGTNTMTGVSTPLSITSSEVGDVTVTATFGNGAVGLSATNSSSNDNTALSFGDTGGTFSHSPGGGNEQGIAIGAGITIGKVAGGDPTVVVTIASGTTAAELRLTEPSGSGSNYTSLKAQAQAATINYTLPAALPTTNEVLAATSVSGSDVTLEWVAASGSASINNIAAGRLTLTSGTPVLTTTVTGAGTVYFTPYNGNAIALYNGSAWEVKTFTELSITLSGLTASTAYDVWAYNNAGTVALDTTAWTNVTTRATALAFQDGVYVKSGDATRRYVGSIVLDASEQCSVNFGGSADGGTAGRCDIWNFNNRVDIAFCVRDTTNSWAWTTLGWQQANASAGNQVTLFLGLSIAVRGSYTTASGGTANVRLAGIGLDATNALANFATSFPMPPGGTAAASSGHTAMFDGLIDVGQHYLAAIEYGNGSVSFYGDNNTTQLRSGLIVRSEY